MRHLSQPTLSDVATEAGVSLATASRVLNGSTRKVAEAYRERVEKAALKLGYTANIAAQTTARGTSSIVALLVADISDPFFSEISAGVARKADEAGCIVTIAETSRDPERELTLVRTLRGQRPRGVILAASRTTTDDSRLKTELQAFQAFGGNAVVFGGHTRPALSIDNAGGARQLGLEMAGLGYHNAIILGALEGIQTSDERIRGFTAGFTEGGGHIDHVYRGKFQGQSGLELMRSALQDGLSEGTLVFGVSDVIAIGAMTAARDLGYIVGGQLGFCGFDDIPLAHDMSPSLTTVRIPLKELGMQACDLVLNSTVPEPLPLEVVVRGSTPGPSHR